MRPIKILTFLLITTFAVTGFAGGYSAASGPPAIEKHFALPSMEKHVFEAPVLASYTVRIVGSDGDLGFSKGKVHTHTIDVGKGLTWKVSIPDRLCDIYQDIPIQNQKAKDYYNTIFKTDADLPPGWSIDDAVDRNNYKESPPLIQQAKYKYQKLSNTGRIRVKELQI